MKLNNNAKVNILILTLALLFKLQYYNCGKNMAFNTEKRMSVIQIQSYANLNILNDFS